MEIVVVVVGDPDRRPDGPVSRLQCQGLWFGLSDLIFLTYEMGDIADPIHSVGVKSK